MLKGKVAIITGGTKGIGYATCKLFLENNAKVVLLGSKKETVEKAINSLSEYRNNVIGFFPNLNDENEIRSVFAKTKEMFGSIDILINNAGVSSKTPIENYTYLEYKNIIDLNLNAIFLSSKIAVEYMKEKGGVILNTSSLVSIFGQPSGCAYPISKFGVNGLTKSLARELGKYNIRVNAVAPGVVKTEMVANLPENLIKPIVKNIPLGRMAEPIEIANAFLFLASDNASYISGAILSVDAASMV